jgi:ubiquinone/menaquinone biosynthesis C-methylase UbiE
MVPSVDYDLTDLPVGYDRARDHGPDFLALWMSVVASLVDPGGVDTILDLGCGTGRFSEGLAARFNARVVGIDPSAKMLERAQTKRRERGVLYGRGMAEAVPIADGAVDFVFMSMSFHHFRDPRRAARECRRVLRRGAAVVVRTGTREQIPRYPYVPFIPQTRSMLQGLLPDHGSVCDAFEGAGFSLAAHEIVTQAIAPTWAAYADKLAAGGDSVLARLAAGELAAGIEAVRGHDPEHIHGPVVEPIDVLCFRLSDKAA